MRHPVKLMSMAGILLLAAPALAQEEGAPEEIEAAEVTTEAEPAPVEAPSEEPAADGRSPIDGVLGHFGLGYFTNTAPVGMRYWFDREAAFDVGIDAAFFNGNVAAHRYGIELGYVMALAHYHYSVVFARAGLGFRYLDALGDNGTPAQMDVTGSAFVGAELVLGAFGFPNISLQGGYGIEADYTFAGGSAFFIGTANGGLSVVGTGNVGFHIYL